MQWWKTKSRDTWRKSFINWFVRKKKLLLRFHIKKATSKTATQQTNYRNNLHIWQVQLRNKSSLRENYLVWLIMLSLITKSRSSSIQFLLEELLKSFDATCAYAMLADRRSRQMISAIVMLKITSIPKKHWRTRSRWSVLVLLK